MDAASSPNDQARAEDERTSLRRALADLENAKARVERDAAKVASETRTQLVTELLPVLDNLDRTLAAGPPGDPMVQGVSQVRSQLEGVLRGYGLERFDAAGQRFDPRVHDAVAMTAVAERERDGTVVAELEAGYRAGGRVLRPAKVTVGRYTAPQPHPLPQPPPQPLRPTRPSVLRFPYGGRIDDDDWF